MPSPYKGTSFERTIQQKYTKPRHQPSDRDQQAQQRLKLKLTTLQHTSQPDTQKTINDPPLVQNNEQASIAPHQLHDPTFNISELDLCSTFHSMKA